MLFRPQNNILLLSSLNTYGQGMCQTTKRCMNLLNYFFASTFVLANLFLTISSTKRVKVSKDFLTCYYGKPTYRSMMMADYQSRINRGYRSRLSKLDRHVIRKHKEIYPQESDLASILRYFLVHRFNLLTCSRPWSFLLLELEIRIFLYVHP